MNSLLKGKTAMVSGGTSETGIGIVQSFLKEDARVIVTTSSSEEIERLKSAVKNIPTGELITGLIDDEDFEQFREFTNYIKERFATIDLMVSAHSCDLPPIQLSEIEIFKWRNIMDECIIYNFIAARLSFEWMKEQHFGMFVVVSDADFFSEKRLSPAGRLASAWQFELSLIFSEEVKPFNIDYYHMFSGRTHPFPDPKLKNLINPVSPEQIGSYIIKLLLGKVPEEGYSFLNHLIWPWDISSDFLK